MRLRWLLWAAALAGLATLRAHFVAQGAAQVQARWDAQQAQAQAAQQRLELERNAQTLTLFRNAERIADEQVQRAAELEARLATGSAVLDSLRRTIATLNDRPLPTATTAQPEASAADAATARELLGACAARYLDVATKAEQLRDQVMGLQAWLGSIDEVQ